MPNSPRHDRDLTVKVRIRYEWLGSDPGLWCPTCLLPSAHWVHLVMHLGTASRFTTSGYCPDCGTHQCRPPARP